MVLLICANFPPEPVVAAGLSYDLAMALSEQHRVTVVTPRPSRPCGFSFEKHPADHDKFEHVVLDSFTCPRSTMPGRMYESYSFGKHAVKYIRKRRKEISCLYISVWPLLAQYLIVKLSARYAIPSVVHVQDIYPESLSNKIKFLEKPLNKILLPLDRYILKHTSRIVANSEAMRTTFVTTRGIPSHKITLVRNWQDENKFSLPHQSHENLMNSPSPAQPFTFMYLGNIGPVAGVEFIIRSFIKAQLNGARLVVAGSGSQKEKCMQIAAPQMNRNIVFTDVPSGKVTEVQNRADTFILPTRKGASLSSIPSKLISYMLSKKPVIACVENESDIAGAVRESNCGWIVPPEDTESLIRAMKMVISLPGKEMRVYGENGFNYAIENFSKKKNLQLLVTTITQVITPEMVEAC